MTTHERLFGFQHAFDQPVTRWITGAVAGLLLLASLVIWLLVRAGVVKTGQRKELRQRTVSWMIMAPLIIGPQNS